MQFHKEREKILIIDFGSQVTKLIGRNIRELGVYSEIVTIKRLSKNQRISFNKRNNLFRRSIICHFKNYQTVSKKIFEKNIPILGICYGLQLIAKLFGGKIKPSRGTREFGRAYLTKKTLHS